MHLTPTDVAGSGLRRHHGPAAPEGPGLVVGGRRGPGAPTGEHGLPAGARTTDRPVAVPRWPVVEVFDATVADDLLATVASALERRLPVVVVLGDAVGVDPSHGMDALATWGRAAHALSRASGVVPTVAIVDGQVSGAHALVLGLVDHVVLTARALVWVEGPGRPSDPSTLRTPGSPSAPTAIDPVELGGPHAHAHRGLGAALVADDLDDALDLVADLLDHVGAHVDELPPRWPTDDPGHRATPELRHVLPDDPCHPYDVRAVIESIVDHGEVLELRAAWAPNLVTALARIDGRPVGVVANQPARLAGTIDVDASQKGARFVAWCDAMNVPLVTLVDTPGFFPGRSQEERGMIRHGAQLAFAYARATVPRVSVTLRKSYGGAYIVMDSKRMGCDLAYAWPTAQIAVMGARGAAEILHRSADPAARRAAEEAYEAHHLNPWRAAERGLVDAVIDPADTRAELSASLHLLASARESLPTRAHDNSPL